MSECSHANVKRGKDAPAVWGSWRAVVCKTCGASRLPDAGPNEWRPASEYDEATAPAEDA